MVTEFVVSGLLPPGIFILSAGNTEGDGNRKNVSGKKTTRYNV